MIQIEMNPVPQTLSVSTDVIRGQIASIILTSRELRDGPPDEHSVASACKRIESQGLCLSWIVDLLLNEASAYDGFEAPELPGERQHARPTMDRVTQGQKPRFGYRRLGSEAARFDKPEGGSRPASRWYERQPVSAMCDA